METVIENFINPSERGKTISKHPAKALYDEAISQEDITLFEAEAMPPEEKLKHLTSQFDNLTKIGQLTVYQQGETLVKIKKTCRELNQSFVDYVTEMLRISPKTATSYMNVFYYCFGHPDIALRIPPSILYKVCTESVDDEIREFLFSSGLLENITNEDCKKLLERAKTEGIEAIEKEVDEINRDQLIYHQAGYSLDLTNSAFKMLRDLKEKIERRGRKTNNGIVEFTVQIESDQPEAYEINSKLHSAFEQAMIIIETAISESSELLNAYKNRIL
ncbi:MAG: hypothetical protein RBT15_10055 [Gudongella sp.]|jgi:hypothetical protein|nr:hypothetical protein [Gudongella sp.]